MATYGIDLGTTYSAIATLDDNGKPVIIKNNADASDFLASAIYFPPDDNSSPVIGDMAKNMSELEPDRVIQFIKRDIGKPNGRTFNFGGTEYNPITISSLILKRLAEYAKEQGHDVHDVIITCPAYFGIEERKATRQAGKAAGFNVLDIINEPTAAALNYCAREFKDNRTIMVYDLGGGTFDVTILKMSSDDSAANINIVRFGGNDRLGGKDWDDRLYLHLFPAYCEENKISAGDAAPGLKQTIRSESEKTKRKLTTADSTRVFINYDGKGAKLEVTREQFNDMTKDLLSQTMGFIDSILAKSKMTEQDIDIVLLVGGSTFMPMVSDAVKARFPGKVRQEDPNLAVAKGAALFAAMKVIELIESGEREAAPGEDPKVPLALGKKRIVVNDKAPRSFGPGIMFGNEYMVDNLILINQDSPVEVSETYVTPQDNMPLIELKVFENLSEDPDRSHPLMPCEDAKGNEQETDSALMMKKIGQLDLPLPPETPKGSPVEVTFKLDPSGLFVRARDPKTGKVVDATFTSANTLTEKELEKAKTSLGKIKTSSEA